ncbi:MAG: hypothetical protein IM331_01055 [Microcystis sp. M038S1]|nr:MULTISPECIES: hypothetical protein [unclassified Microcystis]MCA2681328.1 hypothetical protein [Microcystis sp. M043S2]MCA2827520.1 hypothetical protein [Microcystis sp. M088S1]MCA2863371.1 hypothetical protein [Microcystis sp. M049S1]MCA2928102.1 hypothetical protein [Microcystis sp. M020S1]MCA2932759.1 hypothetical protein [Microcystis sp. M018S1]MCA2940697.1 hypothetical protein [Microcystis sp. M113S1]
MFEISIRDRTPRKQFFKYAIALIRFGLSKIWVKTPSFEDGFKLQWKKR